MTAYSPGVARGPVTMMGMAGGMSDHLASIEKLSNGYIVRFQKAQKIMVKQNVTLEQFGFDSETKGLMKLALEKLKEGESWKVPDELREAAEADGKKPVERWTTVPMALACKTEQELVEAIRQAVAAHGEIEKLRLAGDFGPF